MIESEYKNIYNTQNCFRRYSTIESKLMWGTPPKNDVEVSFIIPTYNRIDELKKTIQSILKQHYKLSHEIIIIDNSCDCSNENKIVMFLHDLNNESILLYVNEENLGQAGNWNRGAEIAHGRFLSYVHDDDLIKCSYLEEIEKYIHIVTNNNTPFGAIKASFVTFTDDNSLPNINNKSGLKRKYLINTLFDGLGPTSCPTCGTLFSRKAIISVGGFNEDYYPAFDYVLGFKLQINGYAVYETINAMGYYRIGMNESLSVKAVKQFYKCDQCFRHTLYQYNKKWRLFGILLGKYQDYDSIKQLKKRRSFWWREYF